MASKNALDGLCSPEVSSGAEVLMLGEPVEELQAHWRNALDSAPDKHTQRYELAVLVNPQAPGHNMPLPQLLAAARDQWARQVLVLIEKQTALPHPESEFFALGYTRRPLPQPLSQRFYAYGFSIANYKTTPDWLNARFWANPERWNKR